MTDAINSDPLLLAQQAVNFLRKALPVGPWCLTAIQPKQSKDAQSAITTATFQLGQEDAMRDFILQWNERRNLYWHVNSVSRPLTKKAERTDIKQVDYFQVDVDPREDRPLEAERERILKKLTVDLPKRVPEPTILLDSGNGVQAFWALEQPISINGEIGLAEDAKRYNQELEALFEGDNCHDISRLMRLPYTWNLPDWKKLAKGRTKALARVLQFKDVRYPLNKFHKLAAPVPRAAFHQGADVKPGSVVRRLQSVDELDEFGVPDRVKIVIVQGNHPEQPKEGDNSRSAWLFDAVCQLVRFKVPDETIYSIITDPGFGISESVLGFKDKAEQYAIRQIEKAKEKAINPKLAQMNDKYAVVVLGSKTRVARWGPSKLDAGKTQVIHLQEFGEFKNALMNEQVEIEDANGNPTWKPIAPWWLGHAHRRQYLGGMRYAPGQGRDLDGGFLNLFAEWGVEPAPGDWSLMQAHILNTIAQGDADHALYITRWCAWALQHPGDRAGVALVLQGKKGTGKGAFAEAMVRLFGRHGRIVLQQDQVVGKFNAHLEYTSLLFADEAFAANQKQAESVLKGIVTSPTLEIEGKGRDTEQARNCLHIILASNDQWVVPATQDERRWAVFTMSDEHAKDEAYFGPLFTQMESGGHAAMLHDLLAMPLGDWHPRRDIPETDALAMQKQLTLRGTDRVMYQMLASGSPVGCVAQDAEGNRFVSTSVLVEKHDDLGEKDRHSIGTQLKLASEDTSSGAPRLRAGGVQHRGRWLPVLERARHLWALRKGLAIQWPADPFEWQGDVETVERVLDQGAEPGSEVPF